jgi:hypothetical protein
MCNIIYSTRISVKEMLNVFSLNKIKEVVGTDFRNNEMGTRATCVPSITSRPVLATFLFLLWLILWELAKST